jgi:hypothetical protein
MAWPPQTHQDVQDEVTPLVGSTETGRAVLKAVDAAAARTATGAAAASHTHPASAVTSGVLATARLGSGTPAAGTYVDGATGAWTALPAGGGTTDPEVVRDTIATALNVTAPLTETVDDAADTITLGVGAATTSATGVVELATTTEATTGTDTARAVTPAGVKAVADTKVTAATTNAKLWIGTQAAYDAIGSKDATTAYVVIP